MKLSLVVPSYNSRDALEVCLLSLQWQERGADLDFEVVVVDDGSDDDTESMIKGRGFNFPLTYLYLPRTAASGRAAARNAGIRAATGTVVVMIDADEIAPPSFLAAHADYHRRRPDLVVVGPRGYLQPGPVDLDLLGETYTWDALPPIGGHDSRNGVFAVLSENLNDLATCWHFMFSCNVSVRREHLLTVGGFDEGFTGWGLEDSELGFRLRRAGLAFAYHRGAETYHQRAQVIGGDQHADWRRNLTYFTAKHAGSAEVAAQWVFDPALDPSVNGPSWQECCYRFEYAVRALHGRLPGRAVPETIEVDSGNRDEVLATLGARADRTDLIVVDRLDDPELAAAVQCRPPGRELAYFRRPPSAA